MPHDLIMRSASIAPASFNAEARTVDVIWTTGAAVNRRDTRGSYREVLSLAPGHVHLDSLRGASVLDDHQNRGLRNVLGVVEEAAIEGGRGTARIRFSSRPEVEPIVRDVQAGVIRNVSVGYSVQRRREEVDPRTGIRTQTAIEWTPSELSFVPVPADPGATTRSSTLSETTTQDPPANENRAETNQQIRTVATAAGLDGTFANGLIDRGASIEEARSAAFEELVRRGGGTIRNHRVEVGQSSEDPAVRLRHMQEALVCRMMPTQAPSDGARPYMTQGLADMARITLEMRGERIGLSSREELLTRAMHTTSDFPNLLTGTGNRVLMAGYQAAPNPLRTLARQALLTDFRPKTMLKLGELPKLKRVPETGEIKSASRAEATEGYSLETFGQLFSLSRPAIVNDDLGAFSDWAQAMGRAAAETEADQLVTLLTQASGTGPNMGDGKRLFHTDHGNLAASGAAPTEATLSAARLAMRTQKGIDGVTPVNATGKFILISPTLETTVEKLLASIYAATSDDANPFSGRLTPLVEPRLSGNAWYIFADPAVLPVLEYAYLSSAQGPQIASREGWDVLGMEFRVVLDFGCGAVDWRGAYRNPGA
jgi:phage major head subunit gpT-like protein/phage head maturation protease